jgi:hypothetical protein
MTGVSPGKLFALWFVAPRHKKGPTGGRPTARLNAPKGIQEQQTHKYYSTKYAPSGLRIAAGRECPLPRRPPPVTRLVKCNLLARDHIEASRKANLSEGAVIKKTHAATRGQTKRVNLFLDSFACVNITGSEADVSDESNPKSRRPQTCG